MDRTLFLLSPAHCGGRRAQLLLNGEASFPLAVRLRQSGAPLGEVFSFLSGLYFRGKLAYAEAFQEPDLRALVITPGRGLVLPGQWIRLEDLHAIAAVGVSAEEPRFREPLERDLAAVAREFAPGDRVVLLGSIATGKYVDVLDAFVGERLHFPQEFVGRGDMSRGGLMLRCAAEERELDYVAVRGAVRRGARPPRLVRRALEEDRRAAAQQQVEPDGQHDRDDDAPQAAAAAPADLHHAPASATSNDAA